MSLSTATSRDDYVGNGNVDTYGYTFRVTDEDHIKVVVRDTTDPDALEQTLVISTDYTVTGVGNTGGNIVLVDNNQDWIDAEGDLATGWSITIYREVPLTQGTDIRNQGDFYPEVHEDAFDKLTMIDQQQQDSINRSLRMPISVSADDFSPELPAALPENAGATIMVNTGGTGFEIGPTASEISAASTDAAAAAASAAAALASENAASGFADDADASAVAAAASEAAAAATLANVIPKSLADAAGDLIVADAADSVTRLGIGSDGQVLTIDTAQALKVKWSSATIGDASQGVTTMTFPRTLTAADDGKVFVVSTQGTLTLHAATSGFKFKIVDKSGSLSTTAITVAPNGAQKIRGLNSNYSLEANFGVWSFYFDGTDWHVE